MFKKILKSEKGSSTGDIIIFFLLLVITLTFVIRCVDYFIPISKYYSMKEVCRSALYSMSLEGELTPSKRNELRNDLIDLGLSNVNIVSPVVGLPRAKLNQDINLRVECDFTYSTITAYLARSNVTERMVYDKTLTQKKLTN